MKKVLIILLFIIITAAGGFGTFYFWRQNSNRIMENQTLQAQNSSIQAQINSIGQLTTVYEVNARVYSGNPILETQLVPVSVPVSTVAESSITDMSQLIGKFYKVDINPGTILSKDMLMQEFDGSAEKYTKELTFTSLPVSTYVGDYIDLRILLPNSEEYVVVAHKQIQRLYDNTITILVSEEENAIINSAIQDLYNYNQYCAIYLMKYIEPGKDADTVAFYPVQHEQENFIKFNPNIKDTTRCINSDLRDHIDEVLLVFTDSQNQSVSESYIAGITQQHQAQLAAHQSWIEEHTDEEGIFHPEAGFISPIRPSSSSSDGGEVYEDTSQSMDTMVGEAMDSLESDVEDLEAIQ